MTLESVLRTAIVIAFSRSVRFYHEDKQKNMRFFSYAMLAVSIHIVGYIHGNIETKANAAVNGGKIKRSTAFVCGGWFHCLAVVCMELNVVARAS